MQVHNNDRSPRIQPILRLHKLHPLESILENMFALGLPKKCIGLND